MSEHRSDSSPVTPSALKVASLNLRAYFNPGRAGVGELPQLIAGHRPDIVLLQECRRPWLDEICSVSGLVGSHSHDVQPPLPLSPPDGCAIAVRPPFEILDAWRLPPESFQPAVVATQIVEETPLEHEVMPDNLACRNSARTLLAKMAVGERELVVGSFHATPGTAEVHKGRTVHEWKPFFHGAVAIALDELDLPFLFAIDANEPEYETTKTVTFHWIEGRPGWLKLSSLLGLSPRHRARDLLREALTKSGTAAVSPTQLVQTYTTGASGGERRFDHMWATPEFALVNLETYYDEAIAAKTDHALLVADLQL